MTEPTDIRSLLTSRPRPRVAPRDSSLTSKVSFEDRAESSPGFEKGKGSLSANPPETPDFSNLQAELDNLPQVGKRLAIHLDQDVRAELIQLCDLHDLTPEIFLEAALVILRDKPDLIEAAVDEAKVRLAKRKRAGLLRRTIAMAHKYGG